MTRWGLADALDARRAAVPGARRLLIVGPRGLGDTLLALPALRRLRAAMPQAAITWIGRSGFASVVAAMGADAFVASDGPATATMPLDGYDTLLCFADADASFFGGRERVESIPHRIGPAAAKARPRWFNHLVHTSRFGQPAHEARRHLAMLAPFGIDTDASDEQLRELMQLRMPEAALPEDLAALAAPVLLHPYSMGHAREWPAAHWRQLAQALRAAGHPVVFTGTVPEGERFATAWPVADRPDGVHAGFGRLALAQLATLIGRAHALVAASTGPLHLAAALGAPTLGLFVPRKGLGLDRWAALGPAAVSVQRGRHCLRRCDNARCACIAALEPAAVARMLTARPWPDVSALSPWVVVAPPPRPEETR